MAWVRIYQRHSLRGVWIEIPIVQGLCIPKTCHSLRGVWIEIDQSPSDNQKVTVTPLGECGLKYHPPYSAYYPLMSLP